MPRSRPQGLVRGIFMRVGSKALVVLMLAAALNGMAHAQDATKLQARHETLKPSLENNAFKRPIHLESTEGNGKISGDIYAVIDQPFATVASSLTQAESWCDVLILHLNVKRCRATPASAGAATLDVHIGRKNEQPLSEAHRFEFIYRAVAAQADYFNAGLNAAKGPLGTRNYAVVFEAIPLDARRTFLHLSYGYQYGAAAGFAMQTYLATAGSSKIGFSVNGRSDDGKPTYVGGTRGAIERNTMRYYIAIQAYLGADAVPPAQRMDKRLNDWFDGVEQFPQQLRELQRSEYLSMKRNELQRQSQPGE